jgi:hypothetical protein
VFFMSVYECLSVSVYVYICVRVRVCARECTGSVRGVHGEEHIEQEQQNIDLVVVVLVVTR